VRIRYTRALLALMGVLLLFLVLADAAIISYQRNLFIEKAVSHAGHETDLMVEATREALLRGDEAAVQTALNLWGEEHEEIAGIRAVAPDGVEVARYGGDPPRGETLEITRSVVHGGRKLLSLSVLLDLAPLKAQLFALHLRVLVVSAVFVVFMGAVLWYAQRRTVLGPMEERLLRGQAEEEALKKAQKGLEAEVQERTAALREQRDRAEMYLDVAGVMIVVLNTRGEVQLINRTGCEILGYAEADIVGKDWFENFIPQRVRPQMRRVFDDLLAGRGDAAVRYENPVLKPSGEERIVAWQNRVLRDAAGAATGTLSSGEDITGRKRTEERLAVSEGFLHSIIEAEPECVKIETTDGVILQMNPAGLAMVEAERPEQVVGKSMYSVVAPEDVDAVRAMNERVAKGERGELEFRIIGLRGTLRWMQSHAVPFYDEGRGETVILAVTRDVTEKKKAEENLRRSEHSYRTLSESLPGIVYRLTPGDGACMQFFNDAVESMTGYRAEELAGAGEVCSIAGLIIAEDREEVVRTVETAVRENRPFQLEYRILHRDGKVRHFLERGQPVPAASGSPAHIDGVIFDITARKKAEQELRDVNTTLYTLVDHMPEGVVLLDEGSRVVLANPIGLDNLRTLAGARVGDVVSEIAGRPPRDFLVSASDLRGHEVRGPSGTSFQIAARTIQRGGGEESGLVLVLKDVTKARELERRLNLQERLAGIGQLASGIAHDFNNILTSVIGYSEMLLTDRALSEDVRSQIDAIQQSGQRAADLIQQILDFSRKSVSEFETVDLDVFLGEFHRFLRRIIPENILITVETAPGTYRVRADLTKMQQVLVNLAVNARDAMPKGGRLAFALSRMDLREGEAPPFPAMTAGNWVVLEVSDTGEGVPASVLPHIYEPFYTTKGPGRGTGLGLAQVYGIVKQHEGFIDVRTQRGTGTSFFIYLPEEKDLSAPAAAAAEAGAAPRGRGETVLVVEDDAMVRDLVRKVLVEQGYRVLAAGDGAEALEVFAAHQDEIRLVVTDVVMPDIDGIAMSAQMTARKPELRVVAVSGYPMIREKERLREAGIREWVEKPFQAKDLLRVVHGVLTAGA
jgi:two-component system cell cycle sensor histidine kinase/response regulator CckA